MSKIVEFEIKEIQPEKDIVFKELGIRRMDLITERVQNLYNDSIKVFKECSKPVAIYSEISKEEFEKVFKGEGNNFEETPVEQIYPKADYLTLFAVTLGKKVSEKIRELFRKNDFALGSMLDCIASLAAENAVRKMEKFTIRLRFASVFTTFQSPLCYAPTRRPDKSTGQAKNTEIHRGKIITLAYSPGYCGWHINGQRKLFQYLHPEKIGITLNDSFLMIPLKSVSGVLITGKKGIHKFENNFSFCSLCETKSCLERM